MNELASWLAGLRRESKLSLAALSEKTKIMPKHLEALEKGDLEAFPSRVHARAFAMAYARACGADDAEAGEQIQAAFSPPSASKSPRVETALPPPASKAVRRDQAELASAPASEATPSTPLPWRLWSALAIAAVAFLFLLHSAVSCVRGGGVASKSLPASAPLGLTQTASAELDAGADVLELRSRRPCWVLLVIDGQRLPVVLLEPHKKESWKVRQKAVMLAGNIGAVRVWWRGENLGYFGELGTRMNGIVFEKGLAWRRDMAEDLALPAGVPSQAQK